MPKNKDKKVVKNTPDKVVFEEREKEVSELHIRRLQEQLESQKLSWDELQHQFKDATQRCFLLEQEKNDALDCLLHSQHERDHEVLRLLDRVESLTQTSERQLEDLRQQQHQRTEELKASVDDLTQKNQSLDEQLKSLEKFQEQKQKLMSDLKLMQEQMSSQEVKHKNILHNTEMKALLERKKLQDQLENNMEEETRRRVHLKIPEKIKTALEENKVLEERLGELSEQTHVLLKENSSLREQNVHLKQNLCILTDMNRQIVSDSCSQKKVVDQTRSKHQQLQVKLDASSQQVKHLQKNLDQVHDELDSLGRDLASEREQHLQVRAELGLKEDHLEEERRRRRTMKRVVTETLVSLRLALTEENVDDGSDDTIAAWRRRMSSVTARLEELDDNKRTEKDQDGCSAARKAAPLRADLRVSRRYRSGDLGLVPPPALKQRNQRPGPTSSCPQLDPARFDKLWGKADS